MQKINIKPCLSFVKKNFNVFKNIPKEIEDDDFKNEVARWMRELIKSNLRKNKLNTGFICTITKMITEIERDFDKFVTIDDLLEIIKKIKKSLYLDSNIGLIITSNQIIANYELTKAPITN